jgi:hypothetical protein
MSLFDSLFGDIDLKARGEIRNLRATLSKERLEGVDVTLLAAGGVCTRRMQRTVV